MSSSSDNGGTPRRQFASDNYAGICPEAFDALAKANTGHVVSYGDDVYTERACNLIREFFETDCEVFFTFNGTAANALVTAQLCRSYNSVICHEKAHIETDECGAPEFFSGGAKVLAVGGVNAKLDLEAAERLIRRRDDFHFPKIGALSLTQATELGTVYKVDEVKAACEIARRYKLKVHMDGARFANALATLNTAPKAITWQAGVDVLCFGGTKNGLGVGDAVVFFDKSLSKEFDFRCKQAGQLASKMRFLSSPWIGLIESGALLRNAQRANASARKLESLLRPIPGVKITAPVEANSVFALMSEDVYQGLQRLGWRFYTFIGDGAARLMCSWDTTEEDIQALADEVRNFSTATARA